MKKAKIVLSAVALFAVVGGAFAFKAHRNQVQAFKTTTTTNPAGNTITICRVLPGFYDIAPAAPLSPSVYTTAATTATTIPTTFCTLTLRLSAED